MKPRTAQRLHPRIAETQGGNSLSIDPDGPDPLIKRVLAYRAIGGYGLDVRKTSVGSKADLPQFGFVVRLDARVLVADLERGDHAIPDHPRAKFAGSAAADPPIKDQLHLAGPADVQVLADHFFEENPPGDRTVQNLR